MKLKNEANIDLVSCPIRKGLALLGGKWALIILYMAQEPVRYGQLKKNIPDISEKMLIQTLKILTEHKLIKRKDYQEIPPRVEYHITQKGTRALDIIPIFEDLVCK